VVAAPLARLLGGTAQAAVSGPAQRLLVLFTPNGTIHEHWRPSGSEKDFSFSSGTILEPLSELRSDLLILDGMDFNTGDNHEGGMAAMLTAGGLDSIDQYIARQIGAESRFSSLELGVQTSAWGGNSQTRMAYNSGSMVTPDDSPESVWSRLFGGVGDEDLLSRRLAVLDLTRSEINDLHGRLGSAERDRLNTHLDSLESIERSLSGSCEGVISPGSFSTTDNDVFPDTAAAQIDLAIQALACDATRVVSIQMSHTVGPVAFTWEGISDGHHTLSHASDTDADSVDKFVTCERWFAEQFATIVQQLKETADPNTGAPLLDTTLVLWAKELGDGRLHTCVNVPWILAGSGGGFFSTGRYLDLGGATHDSVLTSICQSFGLTNTTFGAGSAGPLGVLR
jgi:hypothetical protein